MHTKILCICTCATRRCQVLTLQACIALFGPECNSYVLLGSKLSALSFRVQQRVSMLPALVLWVRCDHCLCSMVTLRSLQDVDVSNSVPFLLFLIWHPCTLRIARRRISGEVSHYQGPVRRGTQRNVQHASMSFAIIFTYRTA